jgi:guanine nucleotide-binding protein G(i) subunit alpha
MACCSGNEAAQRSKNIDRELSKKPMDQVTILLLGPGDSGKSTIAKQMKIIHLQGFSEQERLEWRPVVYRNAVFGMRILVRKAIEFGFQFIPENEEHARGLLAREGTPGQPFAGPDVDINQQNKHILQRLWADPAIRSNKTPTRSRVHAFVHTCA